MIAEQAHTLVLFGKTGSGKSSILNRISGKTEFPEGTDMRSTTKEISHFTGKFFDNPSEDRVMLVDTPGFYDTESEDQAHLKNMVNFLKEIKEGFTLLCFALPLLEMKFDVSVQLSLKMLITLFGEEIKSKIRIIFTHYNQLKEKKAEERIMLFKHELPGLLESSNIPYDDTSKFYVFDYDLEDGGLGDLVAETKQLPKFQSEVLKTVDEMVQQGIDFNDPIKVLHILTANSKAMQAYTEKVSNLEQVIKDLEESRKHFQAQIEERDHLMYEKEKEIQKLYTEMQNANKEDRKKITALMDTHKSALIKIQDSHQEQLKLMQKEMEKRENENRKRYEEMQVHAENQRNREIAEKTRQHEIEQNRYQQLFETNKQKDNEMAKIQKEQMEDNRRFQIAMQEMANRPPIIIEKGRSPICPIF